jgi:hypothetical protein
MINHFLISLPTDDKTNVQQPKLMWGVESITCTLKNATVNKGVFWVALT